MQDRPVYSLARMALQPFGLEPAVVGLLPAVVFGCLHGLATLRLVSEKPRSGRGERSSWTAARLAESLTATLSLTRDRGVRMLFALSAAMGAVIVSWETLWPPRLSELVPGPPGVRMIGFVLAASFAGSALAAALTGRLGATRPLTALVVAAMVMAGATAVLAAANTGAHSAAGLIGAYLGLGGIAPMQRALLHRALLHRALSARHRTTALSVDSLCLQLGVIVGGVALAYLAQPAGVTTAWLIGAAILAATTALLPRSLRRSTRTSTA